MTGGLVETAPIRHERILASAGAGKTYALSGRYVALLASGAPVRSMLASTFTRAAAAEIRDRILVRLVDAAEDEERRAELAGAIGRSATVIQVDHGKTKDLPSKLA